MKPALLFYCQHSVGLGHLMRSYALCEKLAERFSVVLLCGGELPAASRRPRGVEIVALPPLGVSPGAVRERRPALHDRAGVGGPRAADPETLRRTRPEVVLVELFPFGRAKFARELVPLLEQARAQGAFTACSLRDILVSTRDNQARRRPRGRARRRPPGRRARPLRPALRTARGDLQAERPAAHPRPLHGLRRQERRGAPRAASTSSSRPAAAAWRAAARSGDRRRPRPAPMPRSPARSCRRRLARLQAIAPRNVELLAPSPTSPPSCAGRARISQCGYNTALDLCARTSPRSSSPTRRPRRTSRPAARRRLEQLGVRQGRHPRSTGRHRRAARLHARADDPRPRRRGEDARPPGEPRREASCAPYILEPVAARSLGRAAPARRPRPPPSSPSRGRSRSIVDHLIARPQAPFSVDTTPAGRDRRADPRDRGRRVRRDLLLQPLAAERGRAHRPRAARRDLRPPPAPQPRLPPAHPQGRPPHPRDRGRQRHGRAVLRHARRDAPVRAARGGHDGRAAVHRPACSRCSRSRPRRCSASSASCSAARCATAPAASAARRATSRRVANEALSAMAVVKAFGAEAHESERVRDAQRAAHGRRRRGRPAAGALRRHRRRRCAPSPPPS